jgi:hypothetical protein
MGDLGEGLGDEEERGGDWGDSVLMTIFLALNLFSSGV